MTCPFCGHKEDRVIDSRESKEGDVIRRRRECLGCERRFTTYERSDEIPYMVVKKDGRREKFDRQKVLNGLLKACEKRPVPMAKLAEVVDAVEAKLGDNADREITTTEIGEMLMERLRGLDKIAYVRFASVYQGFETPADFERAGVRPDARADPALERSARAAGGEKRLGIGFLHAADEVGTSGNKTDAQSRHAVDLRERA